MVGADGERSGTSQSGHTKRNQNNPVMFQDTNSAGLTVTANPLAFAMEDSEI